MNNELEIIDGNNDFLKVKDTKKEKRRKEEKEESIKVIV